MHTYPSEMAQNFWTAIFAWTTGLLVTIFVSLFTEPRRDDELTGLVLGMLAFGLTLLWLARRKATSVIARAAAHPDKTS